MALEIEQLREELDKANEVAGLCQGEAAIYRKELIELCDAVDQFLQTNNSPALHQKCGLVRMILSQSDAKRYGKILLERLDVSETWLSRTLDRLEKIENAAKTSATSGTDVHEILEEIIELSKDGLAQQL